MARLTQDTRDKILADFHIGKSQNWLAKNYECSPATVNKLCKGVIPKFKDKVNTVATIQSELMSESEYQSECFNKEVNDLVKHKGIITNLTELNLSKLGKHLKDGKAQKVTTANIGEGIIEANIIETELQVNDYRNAQDTIDKASITLGVNQRHANQQINVNTQTNIDNKHLTLNDFYEA